MQLSFAALYAVALAGFVAAQQFTVATPASVVQCQPASLSWSGGTAPYFPSIIPGSQPGAAALKEFPSQTATSLVWTVDLAQGTSLTIQVRDSTGTVQYSSAITIQNSADASCVNASVSATASGAPATTDAGATTAPASTTPAATSAAASSSAAASGSASHTSAASVSKTSAAASASASPNAASTVTKGAFGVAALAGLIGAALF